MIFTRIPGGRTKTQIENMINTMNKNEKYSISEFRNYSNKIQFIFYSLTTSGVTKPCAMYWLGNSSKLKSFYYKSEADREIYFLNKVSDIKQREDNRKIRDEQSKESRKNTFSQCQIGDIFYRSFGYSVTFIDFFQVVGKKGSTKVLIRPINSETITDDGGYTGYKKAMKDSFISDDIITTSVSESGLKFKGNYYHKTKEETTHYFNTMD